MYLCVLSCFRAFLRACVRTWTHISEWIFDTHVVSVGFILSIFGRRIQSTEFRKKLYAPHAHTHKAFIELFWAIKCRLNGTWKRQSFYWLYSCYIWDVLDGAVSFYVSIKIRFGHFPLYSINEINFGARKKRSGFCAYVTVCRCCLVVYAC